MDRHMNIYPHELSVHIKALNIKIPDGFNSQGFIYLYSNSQGESIWYTVKGNKTSIVVIKENKFLRTLQLHHKGTVQGSGLWTVCSNEGILYKNYFYSDHMVIEGYSILD